MNKVWKIIKPCRYKNILACLKAIKKNKMFISPWVENVVKNKKNRINNKEKSLFI